MVGQMLKPRQVVIGADPAKVTQKLKGQFASGYMSRAVTLQKGAVVDTAFSGW